MSREQVSRKLEQLLNELSDGEVHCVVLAATTSDEHKSIAFGMEMNTRADVATALLNAGLKHVNGMQFDEALNRDLAALRHKN